MMSVHYELLTPIAQSCVCLINVFPFEPLMLCGKASLYWLQFQISQSMKRTLNQMNFAR